jgi:uncharacterized protein YndB with AHSA1/START domain
VRFERLLPGPIERVWAYLRESDKPQQWLATGQMEQRVGAAGTLRFGHAALSSQLSPLPERFKPIEEHSLRLPITRFEPPSLLAWNWVEGKDGLTEVIFELTPHGEKVRLVLTHRRRPNRAAETTVLGPWTH